MEESKKNKEMEASKDILAKELLLSIEKLVKMGASKDILAKELLLSIEKLVKMGASKDILVKEVLLSIKKLVKCDPEYVNLLFEAIDLKTGLGIKILEKLIELEFFSSTSTSTSTSPSPFVEVILEKIKRDSSYENIWLCMKAITKAIERPLEDPASYIDFILMRTMECLHNKTISKDIARSIILVASNFMPKERVITTCVDRLECMDSKEPDHDAIFFVYKTFYSESKENEEDKKDLYKSYHQNLNRFAFSLGLQFNKMSAELPSHKEYGVAEKSATVASSTPSSGNPSYEKYEELSRPLDSGVAGLSSSSKTPGQKTKESDSLFKDNELAEDLKRMFSEDESEKTVPSKKEEAASGSESRDKKKGKQQKLLKSRNEKQSGVACERGHF